MIWLYFILAIGIFGAWKIGYDTGWIDGFNDRKRFWRNKKTPPKT